MVKKFEVKYEKSVLKEDIPKISFENREIIRRAIECKLMTEPEKYGKFLRKSLKGYRKLRVSDFRIIFRIEGAVVKIFAIQHRSVVYKYGKVRILD